MGMYTGQDTGVETARMSDAKPGMVNMQMAELEGALHEQAQVIDRLHTALALVTGPDRPQPMPGETTRPDDSAIAVEVSPLAGALQQRVDHLRGNTRGISNLLDRLEL